jgi:hypothetical protein
MQLIGVSNWSMTSLIRPHNAAEIAKICSPIEILTENSSLLGFISPWVILKARDIVSITFLWRNFGRPQ